MHEMNTIEVLAGVCLCVCVWICEIFKFKSKYGSVCVWAGIRENMGGEGKLFHLFVAVAAVELIKYSDQMRKI